MRAEEERNESRRNERARKTREGEKEIEKER